MRQTLVAFLEGLIGLLEKLPQKPEPAPAPVEKFLLTGEDRELIRRFLQSTKLTAADYSSDEPKYLHANGQAE
jgi:hypothetical protein